MSADFEPESRLAESLKHPPSSVVSSPLMFLGGSPGTWPWGSLGSGFRVLVVSAHSGNLHTGSWVAEVGMGPCQLTVEYLSDGYSQGMSSVTL